MDVGLVVLGTLEKQEPDEEDITTRKRQGGAAGVGGHARDALACWTADRPRETSTTIRKTSTLDPDGAVGEEDLSALWGTRCVWTGVRVEEVTERDVLEIRRISKGCKGERCLILGMA